MVQPLTLCLHDVGRTSYILGEFQTPVQELDFTLLRGKQITDVRDGLFGVEIFAGKYVQTKVVFFREGVNADMTLGNKHKT